MATTILNCPDETVQMSKELIIIKEMHHRVKNDLQLILSLINLQLLEETKTANEDFLKSLKNRVQAISLVNNCLSISFDDNKVGIDSLLNNLIDSVYKAYSKRNDIIIIKHIEKIELENKFAVPIGLIVNELLTNALKHAFPLNFKPTESKYCEIAIILRKVKDKFELSIRDNGVSKLEQNAQSNPCSKGLILVSSFVEQLNGSLIVKNIKGTDIQIEFCL